MHAAPTALRPDPLIQWPEASALVQQIAEQIAEGRIGGVPPLDALAIDADGKVHVNAAGAMAETGDGEAAAAALRDLFHQLVGSNPVPAAVAAGLQTSSDDGSPIGSAEAFSRAARYFVRPSADRDLRAVAARMNALDEEARLRREMEALTRHARVADVRPPEGEKTTVAPARRRITKRRVVVAVLVVVALSFGALFFGPSPSEGLASATPVLQQGTALVKDAARAVFGREEVEAATPVEAAPAAQPQVRKSRPRSAAPSPSRADVTIDPAILKPVAAHAPSNERLPASLAAAFTVPLAAVPVQVREGDREESLFDDAVFDARDIDVTPAALVRPYLRTDIPEDVPAGQFGRLEVVISETGEVERVRLLATTPERRYRDAMLMHAAKNWVFKAARRHGVPVRYRLQVLLMD